MGGQRYPLLASRSDFLTARALAIISWRELALENENNG